MGGSHEENGIIERANKEVIRRLSAIIHENYIKENGVIIHNITIH
jgi:hypothetical protein